MYRNVYVRANREVMAAFLVLSASERGEAIRLGLKAVKEGPALSASEGNEPLPGQARPGEASVTKAGYSHRHVDVLAPVQIIELLAKLPPAERGRVVAEALGARGLLTNLSVSERSEIFRLLKGD